MRAECSWCGADMGPRPPYANRKGEPFNGTYLEVCLKPECREQAEKQRAQFFAQVAQIP